MMSVSSLIEFLMNLMRDEAAKEAFDQDPQGELNRAGLDGVSGQDVRDARLIMGDNGGVRPRSDHHGSGSRSDDPVREIHHTTNNYVINEGTAVGSIDQTIINIDDRDTTVVDSFNSADTTDVDVVAVQDNSQTNTDIDVTDIDIEDSFNEEPAEGEPGDEEPTDGTEPVDGVPGDQPSDGAPDDIHLAVEPDNTLGGELDDGGPAGGEPLESEPVDSGPVSGIDPVESEPIEDAPDLDAAVI